MSSQPRTESPGSNSHQRIATPRIASPEEDALEFSLGSPGPSTDDVPTIISRQTPAVTAPIAESELASIRGKRLAHFELIEPIGVGGMAAVLRARDTQLDRFVALKILPQEMALDEENVRRFHQEARSAAKLDHENIARVYFCGEDQRLHFIAFEFVEGNNLRTIIDRRGRLPLGEALRCLLQIAAGLSHAARRGVVHRDIKPSNIIVTPDGRAKLVDMGLARCQEAQSGGDLTQSGVTLGTFDYISPEQALEPREADVRSDIYSLGCTFYHVLTGKSPVPEGTAAKKLNCHQNVKPPDPREYVPDLPVEVVHILDRMMAKQPRDRFQTPEELVTQLLVVAGKLGISAEVPEGVLILDAALPNAPRGRPQLWVALAVAAVVVLVVLLNQVPSGPVVSRVMPAVQPDSPDSGSQVKQGFTSSKPEIDKEPIRAPEPETTVATWDSPAEPTLHDLADWLQKHRGASQIVLRLRGNLNLSDGASTNGLVLSGKQKVIIKPYDLTLRPPELRLSYQLQPQPKNAPLPLVALTIDAKESVVEGIRFVVDAHLSEGVSMVALLLKGGNQHTVRHCEFVQVQPSIGENNPNRVASVIADGARMKPKVDLRECVFLGFGRFSKSAEGDGVLSGTDGGSKPGEADSVFSGADSGGQDAVVRRGAVQLNVEGCVFGPHSAAFRLEGNSGEEDSVTVQHCSVLLAARRSAAFELDKGVFGKLDVSHSLFSRMAGDTDSEGAVVLRQQADDGPDLVTYQGKDNCYHELDGYWCAGSKWQDAGWSDFRRKVANRGGDDGSRVLVSRPWQAEQVQQLKQMEKHELGSAFATRLSLKSMRHGRDNSEVVGAGSILGLSLLPKPLPPLDEKSEQSVHRCLIVEKLTDEDSRYGIYPSLEQAVSGARSGDTILIRNNGRLAIDPVKLNKIGVGSLTIKPARRFQPVLVLGETAERESAMFSVYVGKLRLEGLEFSLTPAKQLSMQTIVALIGDGECTMKNCVATLQRSNELKFETRLALATVTDAGKLMKSDMPSARPATQGPKLTLDSCFIRGDGDLLWTRASRPFGLEMKQSLVALAGTLVNIEPMPEATDTPKDARTQIDLREATTYLGGSLIRLATGKDPGGLVPITINATNCLFEPAGLNKKMISLEGSDTDGKSLRDKCIWGGEKNTYGNFQHLQAQQSNGEEMMEMTDMTKWKNEESSTFIKRTGPAESRLSQLEPTEFEPPKEAPDSGARLKDLPRPYKKPSAEDAKDK